MILVTGGTGLCGSQLLFDLILSGKHVRAIRRTHDIRQVEAVFKRNNQPGLLSKIEWMEADVLDIISLETAFADITEVYHCAAIVSFDPKQIGKMMQTNIQGTANVVNAALEAKVKKFCHISSIASLGRTSGDAELTENSHWINSGENSDYAISKYGAEREVWRGIGEGLCAVIVNPAVIIGPGDWELSSAKLFSTVWNGLNYYTKGVNGYVDVRDVSKAMILLMDSPIENERFILNSGNISYKELFDSIAHILHKPKPHIFVNPFFAEIIWRLEVIRNKVFGGKSLITRETARMAASRYFYSSHKIQRALDFKFIPVETALKETGNIFLETMKNKLAS